MADSWDTPPTAAEMAGDPWATPPTAQEVKPARKGPSAGGTTVLDLFRRGGEWLGKKEEESNARTRQEYPQLAPHLEMASRLMGMGLRGVPSMKPAAPEPVPTAPAAADPVLEQIQRVNGSGPAPQNPLPELPKMLEWVLPGKTSKIYSLLRKATEPRGLPPPAENPMPGGGGEQWRPAGPPPAQAPKPPPAGPTMSEIATPAAPPAPAPEAPAAFGVNDLTPNTAARLQAALKPQPPAQTPVANIFEKAARGQKVSALAKAIDANASAHLGVDPMDPRFGEALSSMPERWWEGMGQVAKINKPSPDTIAEVLAFYKDRAGQAAQKITP